MTLQEGPGQLRHVAATLDAGGLTMAAAIVRTVAADIELVLQVHPAALVLDDSADVLPVLVRVQQHPDGSLAVATLERVDFVRGAAHLHIALPGRPVVVLRVGATGPEGTALLVHDDPHTPTGPTPPGMCPVPGHTVPGMNGEIIAVPDIACRTCHPGPGPDTTTMKDGSR